tara:strand:+ start:2753 stop:3169 length:417 start_codon:yes stop_codon:yes gene_type:complete
MDTIKNILIALSLIVAMSSCSKEDDEIPLAQPQVASTDFDQGYVGVRLKGSGSMVDSIIYRNTTKGFSFNLAPSLIAFIQGDTLGLLSKPLLNGNTGDIINCSIYLNTTTELGVGFTDVHNIPLDPVSAGKFSLDGTY